VRAVFARLANDGSWGRYHGPHCPALTERMSALCGDASVILCSSGTAAVELALRALKVDDGDEVVMAAYDFKSNFTNVLTIGATPVLVDVRADDWQLDADRSAAAIGPRTAAILVAHLHGGLVDMPRIRAIADERGLPVIEDACQAHGATVCGRPAGTWGDIGVFSFGGSKLLTCGRGGALITRRDDVVQRLRLYTQRGNEAYPLSEMQAAVLLPQWEQLAEHTRRRAENVALLTELLGDAHGLRMLRSTLDGSQPAYYKVGLQYDPAAFDGLPRDRFCEALRAEGIAADPGFRGLHLIHARSRFRAAGELSHATDADARCVTLHHPVLLGARGDTEQIAAAVDKIRRHATMVKAVSGP
jgi:dTDP-4-amino-4,6-dideoxygalactose transaminase